MQLAQGIRAVAALEATKGVLVLLTGFGLFSLLHRNVQRLAEELVAHTHLNPASHVPHVFLDDAGQLDDARLLQLAVAALAYAAVRMVGIHYLRYGPPLHIGIGIGIGIGAEESTASPGSRGTQ